MLQIQPSEDSSNEMRKGDGLNTREGNQGQVKVNEERDKVRKCKTKYNKMKLTFQIDQETTN